MNRAMIRPAEVSGMFTIIFAILLLTSLTGIASAQEPFDTIARIQPPSVERADRVSLGGFGFPIRRDGDRMITGGIRTEIEDVRVGSAFIYERSTDRRGWTLVAELFPEEDARVDEFFGRAVDLAGDTAVVGAPFRAEVGALSGAVYLYQRTAHGWELSEKLVPSDLAADDRFGISVALEGDQLLVGAYRGSRNLESAGVVYVYERDATGWREVQRLEPSVARRFDRFGYALARDGNRLVVGAPFADADGTNLGAAFMFEQAGGIWVETATLSGFGDFRSDEFGTGVAIDGDLVAVGSPLDTTPVSSLTGAAYTFRFDGNGWVEDSYLFAPDGRFIDFFGSNLAVQGGELMVGAENANFQVGATYLYSRNGLGWDLRQELIPADAGMFFGLFGVGLEFDGAQRLISSPLGYQGGAIYVADTEISNRPPVALIDEPLRELECALPGGSQATLDGSASFDPDSTPGDEDLEQVYWLAPGSDFAGAMPVVSDVFFSLGRSFATLDVVDRAGLLGRSVAIVDIVDTTPPTGSIAAPGPGSCIGIGDLPLRIEDSFSDICDAGLSRSYAPDPFEESLPGEEATAQDQFGRGVDLSGDRAVVGAPFSDGAGSDRGAAYIYRRDEEGWQLEAELVPEGLFNGDNLGHAVAIDRDVVAIAAPRHRAAGFLAGAVWVYRYDGERWNLEQKLQDRDFARFGAGIELVGDTLVVGLPGRIEAVIYRYDGGAWVEEGRILGSAYRGEFGTSLSLDGDRLAIGSPELSSSRRNITIWRRDANGNWEFEAFFRDFSSGAEFGNSVSLDGELLAVGAPWDSRNGSRAGAVYFYRLVQGQWVSAGQLRRNGTAGFEFGTEVALDGDRLLVSLPFSTERGPDAGSVIEYTRSGDDWVVRQQLFPSIGGRFGTRMSLDGQHVLIGTPYASNPQAANAGAAYLYDLTTTERSFDTHGDYWVGVTAFDDAGQSVGDQVAFTIDRVPPTLELQGFDPGQGTLPLSLPFTDLFVSGDDDGAAGGVIVERMLWNQCLLFDGGEYGDGDGLLGDEILELSLDTLCEVASVCPATIDTRLTFEAIDCGGNVTSEVLQLPAGIDLAAPVCD